MRLITVLLALNAGLPVWGAPSFGARRMLQQDSTAANAGSTPFISFKLDSVPAGSPASSLSPAPLPGGALSPAPSPAAAPAAGRDFVEKLQRAYSTCNLVASPLASCDMVLLSMKSCSEYIELYEECVGSYDLQANCPRLVDNYVACTSVSPSPTGAPSPKPWKPDMVTSTTAGGGTPTPNPSTEVTTPAPVPPTTTDPQPTPPPAAPDAPATPPPANPPPEATPPPAEPAPGGCTRTINAGDTMYAISLAIGVDVGAIQSLNPGVRPEALQVGQVINVPCSGNPGATPAAPTPPPADLPPATTPPAGGDGIIWGAYAGSGGAVGGPGPAYATYHYYGPYYYTSDLYCADAFNPTLAAGNGKVLLEYPWTAYCNDRGLGPMSQDKCGRHLRVTNPATGQWVITTVVDMCGQGGVDLDPIAFNAIDGDGAGVRDGHMNVILEWV